MTKRFSRVLQLGMTVLVLCGHLSSVHAQSVTAQPVPNSGQGAGAKPDALDSRTEKRIQLMEQAGITEKSVQDAIIDFVTAQEKARQPLTERARTAARALRTPVFPGVVAAPVAAEADPAVAGIDRTLQDFQESALKERDRYKAALKELDGKIHYSANPRLRSFLTLAGILDYDVLMLGGIDGVLKPVMDEPAPPMPQFAGLGAMTPQQLEQFKQRMELMNTPAMQARMRAGIEQVQNMDPEQLKAMMARMMPAAANSPAVDAAIAQMQDMDPQEMMRRIQQAMNQMRDAVMAAQPGAAP